MGQSAAKQIDMYAYDKLGSPNSIRIFELQPGVSGSAIIGTFHQVELPEGSDAADAAPEYTALSYTWGSSRGVISCIWIDGKAFYVRNNLLKALQALRDRTTSAIFWIDALCINQENVYEKNHQVTLMSRIYRHAKMVTVWLGPMGNDSNLVFDYVQSYNESRSEDHGLIGVPLIDALVSLLRRDYWRRAWIVQEVILAREINLCCGTAILTWYAFSRMCAALEKDLPASPAFHLVRQRKAILSDHRMLLEQTLESLIRTYHKCECSDPRDRVFALLSLAADCVSGQGIAVDYALPRLELLVKVLEFCRPDDPIGFTSVLFSAFAQENGDEAWRKAAVEWEIGRSSRPNLGLSLAADAVSAGQKKVEILHFVIALSASRDWVRHHSCVALLELQQPHSGSECHPSAKASFTSFGPEIDKSKTFSGLVRRLDDSNIATLLHTSRYAVISTNPITAAVNLCDALRLHAGSSDCTWAQCARLKVVEG